jgi:hypothetical protein
MRTSGSSGRSRSRGGSHPPSASRRRRRSPTTFRRPRETTATRNPGAIRAEDTEPYLALQYVARLFKIAAMVVVVALAAEIVVGFALEGRARCCR